MKLLALAAKDVGNKRPGQLPNPGRVGNDYTKELLEATLEQNEILLQILAKDTDIYFDDNDYRKLAKKTEPHISAQQERKQFRRRRAPGFA